MLDLTNNVNKHGMKDLKVLLMWTGIANVSKKRVVEKLIQWKQIISDGNSANDVASHPSWTDEIENKLGRLMLATIHIGDMSCAWFEEQQKHDTALVIERMMPEDRVAFLERFASMAASDIANHDQPKVMNITPI